MLKVENNDFSRYGHQCRGNHQSHRNYIGTQIHTDVDEYFDRDKHSEERTKSRENVADAKQHEWRFHNPLIKHMDDISDAPHDYHNHQDGEKLHCDADNPVKKLDRRILVLQDQLVTGFVEMRIVFFVSLFFSLLTVQN